jgi:Icc protein
MHGLGGGIATSITLDNALAKTPKAPPRAGATKPFSFLQISDTHVGFSKPANPDPLATATARTPSDHKGLNTCPFLVAHQFRD